jgi:hypothetical protein
MYSKSRDGKMVGSLSEYQKSLAKEYYSNQVLPNALSSDPEDRLGFILGEAQDDLILCRHLGLIDEIFDDAQDSENTTSEENDKRAWAAEYLVLKAQEKINDSLDKAQTGSSERSIAFTGDYDLEFSKSMSPIHPMRNGSSRIISGICRNRREKGRV